MPSRPRTVRDVRLPARESDHADRREFSGARQATQHPRAELRVLGEHPKGHEVMGLAAAHRLGQLKDGLLRLPLQPAKGLQQQGAHAVRDIGLLEEGGPVNPLAGEMGEIQDRVASGDIKDAVTWCAKVLQRTHGSPWISLFSAQVWRVDLPFSRGR